ncbi:TolC family protein [Rhodocyclus tenuis]|uniref:TolC family protein n=1 Tax=Rhodocyclus tenuis TaxID=1066 RepID=UPI001F5BD75F|nr:TolC family protein [Rhodocyclus tenuis]
MTLRASSASRPLSVLAAMLATIAGAPALADDVVPGRNVQSLLAFARDNNPEYAGMRYEAAAATERVVVAGALPDPKLRTELMDITRGGEQAASLSPSRVGSTRYTLLQELPWFGKRDLKREIAELEAEGAQGRAFGGWADIASRIKTAYAQLFYLKQSERLSSEILDLMRRLEKIAQLRYANGLAAQQDVIRAQVEQTGMRGELIALETEQHHLQSRLNALLGRPAHAALASPEQLRALPDPARLDFSALEEKVRVRNPLLLAEESRVKAAGKSRELAYKNRYPDFTVGFVPNQFQNAVRQWDLMVELNIPLRQSTRRAQEREAESLLAAAQSRQSATATQVLAELSENLAGIDAARRNEDLLANSLLPQAEATFRSALAAYENGKVDFATLLDAQRQIRQARQSRIRVLAEGQARLAEVERLLGEDL